MGVDEKGGEVRRGHGTFSGEIRSIRVDKLISNMPNQSGDRAECKV